MLALSPKGNGNARDPSNYSLRVDGWVEEERSISYDEIRGLPHVSLTSDSRCLEGWDVQGAPWEGVRVRDLLDLCRPRPGAGFVLFCSGDYTTCLSIEHLTGRNAILALGREGKNLTMEDGGPVRLVSLSEDCFDDVKWLDRLSLTRDYVEGTGRTMALSNEGE